MKRIAILFLVSSIFCINLWGQFSEEKIIIEDDIKRATIILDADLDNDSHLDIVTISEFKNIVWYRNLGNEKYDNNKLIAEDIGFIEALHIADLDNDNFADIIVTYDDNKFEWFKNDGNGNFSETTTLNNDEIDASKIATIDIEDDGDLDILLGTTINNTIKLFKNNGSGEFENPEIIYSDSTAPPTTWRDRFHLETIDINNDGIKDILFVSTTNNSIFWIQNEGLGILSEAKFVHDIQNSYNYNLSDIDAGDIDNDGKIDIVFSSKYGSSIVWLKNDGTQLFLDENIVDGSIVDKLGRFKVAIADIDNDGDNDLVSTSYQVISTDNPSATEWFENNGSGIFDSTHRVGTGNARANMHITDLNNDDKLDILHTTSSYAYWLKNNGIQGFSNELTISKSVDDVSRIFAVDIDNDTDLDIISYSRGDKKLAWYNNKPGNVFNQCIISQRLGIITSNFGDINNDGFTDALSASNEAIYWYENLQNEVFGVEKSVSHPLALRYPDSKLLCKDLNGDNYDDLLLFSSEDNRIITYLNDQTGGFNSHTNILEDTNDIDNVFLIDFDNDNDFDILSFQFDQNSFTWSINNGNGIFNNSNTFTIESSNARLVELGDINQDGYIDIILYSNNVSWIENEANNSFENQQIIELSEGRWTRAMHIDDIDNDNDLDIICSIPFENSIVGYINNGESDFTNEIVISNSFDREVITGDINNDDFLDIITFSKSIPNSNVVSHRIFWFENLLDENYTNINGYVYIDNNNNNQFDEGIDQPLSGQPIYHQGNPLGYSNHNGYYNIFIFDSTLQNIGIKKPELLVCEGNQIISLDFSNPEDSLFEFEFESLAEFNHDFAFKNNIPICNQFSGMVFNDANENGIKDTGELGLSGVLVKANNQSKLTDNNGYYEFNFVENQTINISIDTLRINNGFYSSSLIGYELTTPLNPNSYELSTNSSVDGLNFGLYRPQQTPFIDVGFIALNVFNGNQPGAEFHAWMDFRRLGEQNTPCTLRIEHDPLLNLLNSDIPTSNVGNDFVEWIFTPNMAPSWYCMEMQWHLDSNAVEGEVLHWEASYECPPSEDSHPNDNILVRDIVIGSGGLRLQNNSQQIYSMSAAGEMPYELGLEDSIFSYVINFQNKLGDTAYNIIIIDTLPEGVVANSISRSFSSHDYDFRLIEPNIAIWEFKNINLPNVKTDELNSYGFVQFNVLRKKDLPIGTVIENKASILYNNSTWGTTNKVKHIIPDYHPPTALCNEAFEIFLDENGQASITADLIDAGSSDNVGVESLAINQTDFNCADIGDFSIVLSVKDGAQNLDSCSTAIVIKDSLPPTITCTDLDISINTGETYSIQDDINAFTNSDNCGVQSITANQIEFTDGDEGDNAITISIKDDNGNSMDCAINVRIEVVTSILESQYGIELTIAPNPAKDFVRLNFSRTLPFNYNVDLIAVNGQIVKSKVNLSSTSVELERSNLASGVYFVQVRNSDSLAKLATFKVILE